MLTYAIAVVLGTCIMCSVANASESKDSNMYFRVDGSGSMTPVGKVEALKELIVQYGVSGGSGIVKCTPQELSEKGTMRNKKN